MSILLDALKKSEEQRRLGQTPSIHDTAEGDDALSGGAPRWVPIALLAGSALLIAWLGWQQFRNPLAEPTGGTAPPPIAGQPAGPGPATDPTAKSGAGSEGGLDAVARRAGGPVGERTPVESFTAARPVEQDAGAASAPRADGEDTDRAPQLAAAQGTRVERPSGGAAEAEPSQTSTRMRPHVSEPISYWELPQAVRDTLPDFKITVLVYAARPEDRFLLMNGERRVEREQLGDGLVLEEIRREGAVFLYRSYRFLVEG